MRTIAEDMERSVRRTAGDHDAERDGYDTPGIVALRDEPRRLDLHVNMPSGGVLVLADTWYPGWICEVDGLPAAIGHAHGVFREVSLAAGDHVVAFEYQPRSFYFGLAGSAGGLAFVALLAMRDMRLRGRATSDGS